MFDQASNKVVSNDQANKILAFVRYKSNQRLLVISHFDQHKSVNLEMVLDQANLSQLGLTSGEITGTDLLTGKPHSLKVKNQLGRMSLTLSPMQSVVIQL